MGRHNRLTADESAQIIALYRRGAMIKTIATELGREKSTIHYHLKAKGELNRFVKGAKVCFHVRLPAELHRRVSAAAASRRTSISRYVNMLLKRELGL